MAELKQSTATYIMMGPALDSTDAVTEETALSPTVYISKNGGTFAARNSSTAISHNQDGYYRVHLDATDTNTAGNIVAYFQDPASHLPVVVEHEIVTANWWDSKFATDELNVDIVQVAGVAVTGVNDFKATGFSTFDPPSDRVWLASGTHTGSIIGTANTISTAGLAEFASVDTGETVAVTGSVAQLSKSGSGGSTTVGSFSSAALLELLQTDTGETSASAGSVVKISQGASGLDAGTVEQACEDGMVDLGYTAALSTLLGNLAATAGSGGTLEVVTVSDAVSAPIQGADVWVSTDEAGTNIVAGTLQTNSSGQVSFMLDDGTYYVWIDAPNYNETNPYTITVP